MQNTYQHLTNYALIPPLQLSHNDSKYIMKELIASNKPWTKADGGVVLGKRDELRALST